MFIDDIRGSNYFLFQAHKNTDRVGMADTHCQGTTRTNVFLALSGGLGLWPI